MQIGTLPVDGGTPRQLTDAPKTFRDLHPCWSPDGRNVAFMRAAVLEDLPSTLKGNIHVVPADGGEARQITSESDRISAPTPVLWSPDGRLLAYFSNDKDDFRHGTLNVIPAGGGESRIAAKVQRLGAPKEMAWSPDGKRIAYNEQLNTIQIVSLDEGGIVEIKPDLQDVTEIIQLDWSPDGERLVFVGATGGAPSFWMMGNFLPLVKTAK